MLKSQYINVTTTLYLGASGPDRNCH